MKLPIPLLFCALVSLGVAINTLTPALSDDDPSLVASPRFALPPPPSSPEQTHPLGVGANVPRGYTLLTADGKPFDLIAAIKTTPTVLIFYRGGWCPYCTRQMAQLEALEPRLKGLGFQIIGISPDSPANLKKSASEHSVNYTLLSDSEMLCSRRFGLAFRVDDAQVAAMKDHGVDLEAASGNTHHYLPIPAAYVIDKQGIIRFAFSNPDFKVQVNPDKLYAAATNVIVDSGDGH